MSIIEVTGNPRHDQLVHYITERGYMNIEELAQLLDVSTQTVRRDIRKLSEQRDARIKERRQCRKMAAVGYLGDNYDFMHKMRMYSRLTSMVAITAPQS